MLRVCLPHQHKDRYVMQPLVRLGHHDTRNGSLGMKRLSQERNDRLLSSGTEPKADNLTDANLRCALV